MTEYRLRSQHPLRPCLNCGRPTTGRRCGNCTPVPVSRNQLLRQAIAASTTECSCGCGKSPTAHDPMTANHITPQIQGGQDTETNLEPMLRSCNSRQGAQLSQ